jgi:hypothetical protein
VKFWLNGTFTTQIHRPRNRHIATDKPDDRSAGGVVLEGDLSSGGDVDARVFEDHGPLFRIIDAFASIRRVILIPGAGGGLGEVDHGIGSDVEGPVGAIGSGDDDVRLRGDAADGKQEIEDDLVFHGFFWSVYDWINWDSRL